MITREQAADIARSHLISRPHADLQQMREGPDSNFVREVDQVRSVEEVSRAPMAYGLPARLEDSWIVYLTGHPFILQSSTIILVSKEDGSVLYYGSALDEG